MAISGQRPTPPLHRPIVWALAFSLAVHLALLFGPLVSVPAPPSPPPLMARLLLAPKAPEAAPRPAKAPRQAPRHHPRAAHRAAKAKPKPAPPPKRPPPAPVAPKRPLPEPPAEPEAPSPGPSAKLAPAQAEPPKPAPPVPEPPKPAPAMPESAPTRAAVPDPGANLPLEAEIQYILYKGTQGLRVGRTVHFWRVRDGRYHVTSVTEASGIFSLFKPGKLVQTSQGKITANGLVPDAFWIQRGQTAATTDSARFNWDNHTLTLGSYENGHTVPLPSGTQDLVSFVYQMGFAGPPKGTLHLRVTDGRKLDEYDYRVLGVETLDTTMGPIKALHLAKVHKPGERGADIWLGVDYHYLPVKVKLTDKAGDSAEQVISSIRLINPPNPIHSPLSHSERQP